MREIKFRVRLKDKYEKGRIVISYFTAAQLFAGNTFNERYELVSYDEYTNLKDKNGKEIYEGDCLGGNWEKGYIRYCDNAKSLQYYLADFGCLHCDGEMNWLDIVEDNGKLEVIGNIYENPALLN